MPLWDDREQYFASLETRQKVRQLQQESSIVLDNGRTQRLIGGRYVRETPTSYGLSASAGCCWRAPSGVTPSKGFRRDRSTAAAAIDSSLIRDDWSLFN
jgi:hypothetical protein